MTAQLGSVHTHGYLEKSKTSKSGEGTTLVGAGNTDLEKGHWPAANVFCIPEIPEREKGTKLVLVRLPPRAELTDVDVIGFLGAATVVLRSTYIRSVISPCRMWMATVVSIPGLNPGPSRVVFAFNTIRHL